MCSLCITSITNINARLSAGKGTRQVFVQRVHVCKRGMCRCRIYVCLCICACCVSVSDVCACVSCKDSQKRILRGAGGGGGSLGQTGGRVIYATRRRRDAF